MLLLQIAIHSAYSQQKPLRIYTADDGLVSNSIQWIFQDAEGFMWFGSNEGLSIYDGYRFENFSLENKNLGGNFIRSFFQKNETEVWVLHENGIDQFMGRRFVKTLPIRGINTIIKTANGRLLGAGEGGIYELKDSSTSQVFKSEKNLFDLFQIGHYFIADESSWQNTTLLDSNLHIVSRLDKSGVIHKDNFGKYWLYHPSHLQLFDTSAIKSGIFNLLPPPVAIQPFLNDGVNYPLTDSDSSYWFSLSNKGIVSIDKSGNIKKFNVTNGLNTNHSTFSFEDREGNIWFAGNGVIKFFSKNLDLFSTTYGLSSEFVSDIKESAAHHSIWMAQLNGISCLYKNHVYNFPYEDNLTCNWTSLALTGDSLWVGNYNLYLYKLIHDPEPKLQLLRQWNIPNQVGEMHVYKDGSLIVGNDQQLLRISTSGNLERIGEGSNFSRYNIDQSELISGGHDDNGVSLWKMNEENGKLTISLMKQFDSNLANHIHCIKKDGNGNFWLATTNRGIIEFELQKNGSFFARHFGLSNGLPSNFVGDLFIGTRGQVYAGTSKGLALLHLDRDSAYFENLSKRYGFITDIFHVTEGSNGELWMATPIGAIRVKNDQGNHSLAPSVYLTRITNTNMPDSDFALRPNAGSFAYHDNHFNFEFTATTYRNEDKVLYSYQLNKDNQESAWSEPRNMHSLSLVSLSPGDYTLKVKALSTDDLWTTTPAQFGFTIRSPYWNTWWFRILVAGVLIGLTFFVIRYSLHQKFRSKLARSESERQIAQLKHEEAEMEMRALRAQMNPHFIFNSLNSINRFILQNNKAQASEYLTKFSKLVRLILQNSQSSLITLENELEALGLYLELESLRFDNRFEYKVSCPADLDISAIKVPPLIIQPYAENAIWHGLMHKEEKGQLDIELSQENETLFIRVADNGIGRKQAQAISSKSATIHKSMGLSITGQRIAMLKNGLDDDCQVIINDLVAADNSAAGTEVTLKIPIIYD